MPTEHEDIKEATLYYKPNSGDDWVILGPIREINVLDETPEVIALNKYMEKPLVRVTFRQWLNVEKGSDFEDFGTGFVTYNTDGDLVSAYFDGNYFYVREDLVPE